MLRAIGCSVQSLAAVGSGCPDILAAKGGRMFLFEVKDDGGRLTPQQKKWHAEWRGRAHVVWSAEEARKVVQYWGDRRIPRG